MDFTNKNSELKKKKQCSKIFLHNSILMKITGGEAEVSMDNNIHTDIVMDPSMILYIEKGTSIYFKHLKKNPNDCVKVIELEEHLLRSILPVIFHLSFSASNSSSLNVKKYFFTKSKDYLTHIFNEFNDTKEKNMENHIKR
ncbi:hypothetical protein RMP33_002007 [Salmonella enterica]|nr:hypothetical protein [Salmonella enterica]